jgi:DNA topoisomerase I
MILFPAEPLLRPLIPNRSGTPMPAHMDGTFQAAQVLAALPEKNIRSAIERVASRLGNTPTICRKCYIHPALITYYLKGSFVLEIRTKAESELLEDIAGLTPEEAAVLVSLRVALDKATGMTKGARAA